jgi:hypothetical protein
MRRHTALRRARPSAQRAVAIPDVRYLHVQLRLQIKQRVVNAWVVYGLSRLAASRGRAKVGGMVLKVKVDTGKNVGKARDWSWREGPRDMVKGL